MVRIAATVGQMLIGFDRSLALVILKKFKPARQAEVLETMDIEISTHFMEQLTVVDMLDETIARIVELMSAEGSPWIYLDDLSAQVLEELNALIPVG